MNLLMGDAVQEFVVRSVDIGRFGEDVCDEAEEQTQRRELEATTSLDS